MTTEEKLRQLLREKVDSETCYRDIDYRDAPLWPSEDEAIDAVLNDPSYWT